MHDTGGRTSSLILAQKALLTYLVRPLLFSTSRPDFLWTSPESLVAPAPPLRPVFMPLIGLPTLPQPWAVAGKGEPWLTLLPPLILSAVSMKALATSLPKAAAAFSGESPLLE